MMMKQIHIFTLLFSLCAMPLFVQAEQRDSAKNVLKNYPQLRKFYASYIATALMGGGIGVATSTVLTYAEDVLFDYLQNHARINYSIMPLVVALIGWTLESEIRNDIVAGVQSDLDVYQIPYQKHLMFRSAAVASWLNYLKSSSMFK